MTAIHSNEYRERLFFLTLIGEGKTRLIYAVPQSISEKHPWGLLLFVAKDDVSTHNIVHDTPIPWKGQVLTALTVYGFTQVLADLPHHLVAYGKAIYNYLPKHGYPDDFDKRSLIVDAMQMAPIEDVRRENLCGSLYKGPYARGEDPYGLDLPPNLPMMNPFEETLYTPTAKSKRDEPLHSSHTMLQFRDFYDLGTEVWQREKLFFQARGFTLVDGKNEMGWRLRGNILEPAVGDEPAITPDAIRIAYTKDVEEAVKNGVEPQWFGKENSRQLVEKKWLEMDIVDEKNRVPITFTDDEALERGKTDYYDVFHELIGQSLEEFHGSPYWNS